MKFFKNKTIRIILLIFALVLLLKITALFSLSLQEECVAFTPLSEENQQLLQALLCGENLSPTQWTRPFMDLQLYHLVVISGSHVLLFLEAAKKILPRFEGLGLILAFLLSLLTGHQAPLVRGFFQEFFQSQKFSPGLSLLLSGFSCWLVEPRWMTSWSFYLSMLAGLGLQLGREAFRSPTLGAQTLLAIPLHLFSFWGLLANFILAPLVSIFFLYGSWGAVLWPNFFEIFLSLFRNFFQWLGERWALQTPPPNWNSSSWEWRWCFFALAFALAHAFRVHRLRRSLRSLSQTTEGLA
jgi:predicted membrane metal-binding protein